MRLQSLENDEILSNTRADRDFLRFETPIAVVQKDNLPCTGLEDSRSGHNELAAQAALHVNIDEHARLQLEAGIGNRQAYAHGARRHVYLRQNLFDLPGERTTRIRVHCDSNRIARLQPSDVVLEDLRIHPHTRKVGYGVQACRWLEVEVG